MSTIRPQSMLNDYVTMTAFIAAGLSGKLPSMSLAGSQKMQQLDISNTSISQYSACSSTHTPSSVDANDCLPNWLKADASTQTVPMNSAGMLCPALWFNRSSVPELSYIKVC